MASRDYTLEPCAGDMFRVTLPNEDVVIYVVKRVGSLMVTYDTLYLSDGSSSRRRATLLEWSNRIRGTMPLWLAGCMIGGR